MSPMVALLAAALAAADSEPQTRTDLQAQLGVPAEQLEGMILEALPPPPDRVKRVTRYYGTITVDHRAHLRRRAACKTCHGPGAITKLEFTPKVAHDRCVGCHKEEAKGPVDCKGCHVRTEPPPQTVAQAASAGGLSPEPPPAPAPDPANLAAAFAAFETPSRRPEDGGALGREPFHRWLEVGLAAAGHGQGVSVRVASHENFIVVTQSIERLMASDQARTFGLLGAGVSTPIHSKISIEAVGLAGFDAVDRPIIALLPALGARAGIEWRPRWKMFQQVTASVTSVFDLSTRHKFDHEIGGATIYGTVATGFTFPPK